MLLLMVMLSRWYMRRYKAMSELWEIEMHWLEKHRQVIIKSIKPINFRLFKRRGALS